MDEKEEPNYVIGLIVWVVIMVLFIPSMSCMEYGGCGAGDMFLMAIIAIGMLAPAWVASTIFSKKK